MTFRPGYQGCRTKTYNLPGLQNKLTKFLAPPAEGQGWGAGKVFIPNILL